MSLSRKSHLVLLTLLAISMPLPYVFHLRFLGTVTSIEQSLRFHKRHIILRSNKTYSTRTTVPTRRIYDRSRDEAIKPQKIQAYTKTQNSTSFCLDPLANNQTCHINPSRSKSDCIHVHISSTRPHPDLGKLSLYLLIDAQSQSQAPFCHPSTCTIILLFHIDNTSPI